jgi:hypothetical protein
MRKTNKSINKCVFILVFLTVTNLAFSQNFEEKTKKLITVDADVNRVNINSIFVEPNKTIVNKFQSIDFSSFSKFLKDTSIKVKFSKITNLPISIETPREKFLVSDKINSMSTIDTNKIIIKSNAQITSLSFDYFKELQPITRNLDPQNNLELLKVDIDEKGNYHNLFQQKYKGIKIYGNEVVTHLNSEGQGFLFNGKYDLNFKLTI